MAEVRRFPSFHGGDFCATVRHSSCYCMALELRLYGTLVIPICHFSFDRMKLALRHCMRKMAADYSHRLCLILSIGPLPSARSLVINKKGTLLRAPFLYDVSGVIDYLV